MDRWQDKPVMVTEARNFFLATTVKICTQYRPRRASRARLSEAVGGRRLLLFSFKISKASKQWWQQTRPTMAVFGNSCPKSIWDKCRWHVTRKAIWYVSNFRIFKILRNIYLFSNSCLCPVGCLSFVSWKKKYVIFRKFDTSNSFSYDMPAT